MHIYNCKYLYAYNQSLKYWGCTQKSSVMFEMLGSLKIYCKKFIVHSQRLTTGEFGTFDPYKVPISGIRFLFFGESSTRD